LSGHTLNINNSVYQGVELLNQAGMSFTGGGQLMINTRESGLCISDSNFESDETVAVTIISSNGAGVKASYISTVDIQNGSASGHTHGIYAYNDNTITVNGPVISADSHAVFLDGANNTVNVDSVAVTGGTAEFDSGSGAAIIRYEVSSDNGGTWVTAATNTSHTFTGLTNGTAYTFKVRAVNSAGSGAEASAAATPTAAPGRQPTR
jgi:hypothetical protein